MSTLSNPFRATGKDGKTVLYCSFCGKPDHEVKKLIAGPAVYICDECVALSIDILADDGVEI